MKIIPFVLFQIIITQFAYSEYFDNSMIKSIKASHFLTEKNVSYSPDNIVNGLGGCWAVRNSDSGIGESLNFEFKKVVSFDILYWKNGFHDFNLYYQNARAKVIRISTKNGFSLVFLQDQPGFQEIRLSLPIVSDKCQIEILDIYPGSQWKDLAISGISFDSWNKIDHDSLNRTFLSQISSVQVEEIKQTARRSYKERFGKDPSERAPLYAYSEFPIYFRNGKIAKIISIADLINNKNYAFAIGFEDGKYTLDMKLFPDILISKAFEDFYNKPSSQNISLIKDFNTKITNNEMIVSSEVYFSLSRTGLKQRILNLSLLSKIGDEDGPFYSRYFTEQGYGFEPQFDYNER